MRKKIGIVLIVTLLLSGSIFSVFASEEPLLPADEKKVLKDLSLEEKMQETETDTTANIKMTENAQRAENKIKMGTNRAIVQNGTIGTVDWTLDDTGVLTFGGGVFPDNYSWSTLKNLVGASTQTVDFTGPITAGKSLQNLFYGYGALTAINGLEKLDTSNVTNMYFMFSNCASLTNLDLSNFNTSNVTNMFGMFSNSQNLATLNVSNFDTSNVTNMSSMFSNCKSLLNLDVSSFDTSKATNTKSMFSSCSSLTNLDVSSFDTSNVIDIGYMFYDCPGLTNLDVSNFDTSKATNMRAMFYNCKNLTNLDLRNFDTRNVVDMGMMFYQCGGLTNLDVSSFDTSNVTSMSSMFSECRSLEKLDIGSFSTVSLTNINGMFFGDLFKELSIGADFRFTFTDHRLVGPSANAEYTGNWELVGSGEIFTHTQFLAYDGTKPGTYIWERASYNVTYNSNGGSAVTGATVENNAKVTKPTNPTKDGYTFAGWYKEASLTNEWDFLTDLMPTNNITLYAKWNINTYNVTYDAKGGSAVAGETIEYNSAVTEPANPTKTGYTFDGWYKEPNLTNEWDFTTDLMPANNITLYAKWNTNTYNVTYDAKGGSAVTGETVEYNSAVTEPANPTKAGYTFDGWYKEVGLTNQWNFVADLMPANDVTLYAKWKVANYQITYNLDGGTNSSNNPLTYEFAVGVAKFEDPTKEGYKFLGWFESDISNVEITNIGTTEMGDKTLFARWEKAEITGKAGTVNKYNKKGTSTGDTMNLLGVGLIFMVSAGYILTRKKKRKNNS